MNITFYPQAEIKTTMTAKAYKAASKIQSISSRVALFIVLLSCSLAVFLLGPNLYQLFPTNGNPIYNASLTALFLVIALLLRRSQNQSRYWRLVFAFFIASTGNLIYAVFGGYYTNFVQLFGPTTDASRISGLTKLYDTLLVVIPILALTLSSGADLGSIFLKIGNQYRKWGYGIGALVLVNFFTSVLIFFGSGYTLPRLGSAIAWGLVFSLSNSLLEELWVRGLFLKKLVPLIGVTGAVLLTSIAFASLHFLSVAYLPVSVVPIFVANTFTLGLACSILMLKTDSIWGAYLIHAAADLFLFVAILAAH